MANDKKSNEHESLEEELTHVLEEARMILPGIQALIGFQFIAVFNERFKQVLDSPTQMIHFAAIALNAIAIALLLAPAAYHRIAEPHEIGRAFVKYASWCLGLGLSALMFAICADFYLVGFVISESATLSASLAAVLTLAFSGLWFVFPASVRKHKTRRRPRHAGATS